MRDNKDAIRASGAELVVVGSGTPFHAQGFRDERGVDFPLYVDPSRKTYQAAGLKRGVGSAFNPKSLKAAVGTFKKGHRQGKTQGDPWQQGGVFVIRPGDEVAFAYVSQFAGDHPDMADVLEAVRA